MEKLFAGAYKGKKVLVTGHTGFKGSWMALWLNKMGAKVVGFSLDHPTDPCHFQLLKLDMPSELGDIRDLDRVKAVVAKYEPEIIFHMAAQPLVRKSYSVPVETFHTNVIGTVNLLEACRTADSVKSIVCITSDKVYENQEWAWGYRESDRLGGFDPYSASKACAELAIASYRNSFFNPKEYGKSHHKLIAAVRAGNVIGGGDWATDRLIPDIVKAGGRGEMVTIRNPKSTRPWQHVLECLSGYLMVGQNLLEGKADAAQEWNFGPTAGGISSVEEVVQQVGYYWPEFKYAVKQNGQEPHEAFSLTLDCAQAYLKLGWKPAWPNRMTFLKTIGWYREFYNSGELLSHQDLDDFVESAREVNVKWAK